MLLLYYPREIISHYLISMCPLNRRLGERRTGNWMNPVPKELY
jgi:hypothetical protein